MHAGLFCWFHNPPIPNRDYRIFNMRMWSFCMRVHTGRPWFTVSSDGLFSLSVLLLVLSICLFVSVSTPQLKLHAYESGSRCTATGQMYYNWTDVLQLNRCTATGQMHAVWKKAPQWCAWQFFFTPFDKQRHAITVTFSLCVALLVLRGCLLAFLS